MSTSTIAGSRSWCRSSVARRRSSSPSTRPRRHPNQAVSEAAVAKKVLTKIKLQISAGAASPAPPVGPALGQHGVNIMEFCKAFNAQTQASGSTIVPVEITVYEDRSFTFITKTSPAAVLLREALGIDKGSGEPNRTKVCLLYTSDAADDL